MSIPPATGLYLSQFDAGLIRQARELAELKNLDAKRAWLVANDRPEAASFASYDDATVNAMIMGTMQAVLTSLAAGYERELARVPESSPPPEGLVDRLLADPVTNPLGAQWDDVRNSVWDQLDA